MEARHFDAVARTLTETGTRRGLLGLLATLPIVSGLFALRDANDTEAQGRRMRRKKRHKHGKGRHRGQRKNRNKKREACRLGECDCDGESCSDGCCDAQGQCLPDSDFSCGTGGVACAGSCTDDGANPGLDSEESELLARLNTYRVANGLPALAHNPLLSAAAEAHSLDMATRGYFGHVNPEGAGPRERIISHGYDPVLSEENIAGGNQTAAQVFTAWQSSPGHNEVMLRSGFTQIGISRAVKPDSDLGWYWTVTFASPAQS